MIQGIKGSAFFSSIQKIFEGLCRLQASCGVSHGPMLQMHWSSPFFTAPSCIANLCLRLCFLDVLVSCSCCNTNDHKLSGLKQEKFILLQFRGPEVPSQGVGKVSSSGGHFKSWPHLPPSFWYLPEILGLLWLIDQSLQSLKMSSCHFT